MEILAIACFAAFLWLAIKDERADREAWRKLLENKTPRHDWGQRKRPKSFGKR